jgi:MFS family permease
MSLYAVCVVGGPCLAPIIGAAIINNPNLGWQWTEYIQAIITFFSVAVTAVGLPETYHSVLLKRKAARLRRETGDERYWHPQEKEKINLENVLTKYVSRPLRMLFTEPMVTCIAAYASFIYGLLFFQLEAFPIVFREQRGYSVVVSALPFLGLFVGVLGALPINFANQPLYARAVARNKGRPAPEARLPPMFIGGILFSTGLFWFGWTAAPEHHWALPVTAAGKAAVL